MVGPDPEHDDDVFSDIVRREFQEDWRPPTPPPEAFDFNLFDDDESYRAVPRGLGHLSWAARIGLLLATTGLVSLLLALLLPQPPAVLGWLSGLSWLGATVIAVWRLLGRGQSDDDDSSPV
ncbi:MAG: hypothetical protein LBJ44_11030 [Propionibacteriaceae bacterium]|jgi:hypothetical protein|nr:hypothetical protein [Propionibacteriaceae bacterium]